MGSSRINTMNLKEIEYAITIYTEGSFSKAAEKLFISQPALSQSIKRLEEELQTLLFIREGHTVKLTPAGKMLVDDGLAMLQIRDHLTDKISNIVNMQEGIIKFGISPFYSKYYLPWILPSFKKYPGVKIEVVEEISKVLEESVLDDRLDFCLVPLNPVHPRLSYLGISQEEIFLAVPKGHPINQRCTVSSGLQYMDLREVRNEPFIMLKQVQKFSEMSTRFFKEAGYSPRVIFETLSWDTVNVLVASDMGVGFVPTVLTKESFANKKNNYYHIAGINAFRTYAVAFKKEAELSKPVNILIKECERVFNEKPEC